jgi:hypothetical protein
VGGTKMKKDQSHHSTSLFNTLKDTDYTAIIIELKGKEHVCFIDPEDYYLVSRYRWNLQSNGYAVASVNGKATLMHRLIMGVDDPFIQVDHRHHNKLDNRKEMLRLCNAAENRRNSLKHMVASSQFKGVYDDNGKWHVQIFINGKVKNKGRFRCEHTAARVYDQYAKRHFKEFALLNFPLSCIEQLVIPGFQ